MPYLNIWIHFVWATKKRAPMLTKNIRQDVFKHIKDNGVMKNIHIDFVNGYVEHVHLQSQYDDSDSSCCRKLDKC